METNNTSRTTSTIVDSASTHNRVRRGVRVTRGVKPIVVPEPEPIRAPLKPKDIAGRPSDDAPRQKLLSVVSPGLTAELAKLPAVSRPTAPVQSSGGASSCTENTVIEIGVKCKHHACGKTYQGIESLSELCRYHPGEAIFHEGLKFWTCCTRRTSDFEQFMKQEGCKTGDHDWPRPRDENCVEEVKCRYDWHQVGNTVVISIYSKLPVPDHCTVEANETVLFADILFGGGKSQFSLTVPLFDVIKPDSSKVTFLGTKVEVKLFKAEPGSWKTLHLPAPKPAEPEKKSTDSDSSDEDDD
ncbi:cysteine and histidine-rich domain-containing protein 1-like isoform X2 [Sycon ciliatum]|uniref:cysteine and histidine-rich domain-containing protein 1-like isoform X2 n=1 Tax=Sycon ciliatum TaxID=27933 RepID=UPI0020AC0979|eukprot:scpid64024/ scgid2447/ Cysteine and histidine-rich domain-containing protein 1; CHORD domain-containing protein 1; Protein morgana